MQATRRILRAVVLVGLLMLILGLFEVIDQRSQSPQLHADYRTPVANPPVEPDRPDLFEEPVLDVPSPD